MASTRWDRTAGTLNPRRQARAIPAAASPLPANDYELIAEIGWVSDRDFLEQYLENEWDRDVDHRTALMLRKYFRNQSCSILSAQAQVNDFLHRDRAAAAAGSLHAR